MDAWHIVGGGTVIGQVMKGREDGVVVHSYEGQEAEGRGEEKGDMDHFYGRGGRICDLRENERK